jgi:hypothetical protein
MEEVDDFPTVASTEPNFDWDYILGVPTDAELFARYEAKDAEKRAIEARCKLASVVKETPTELWKRASSHEQTKTVKSIKTTAKKWVKKKQIRKLESYFSKK